MTRDYGMNGHRNIQKDKLVEWFLSWDAEVYVEWIEKYYCEDLIDEMKKSYVELVELVKQVVERTCVNEENSESLLYTAMKIMSSSIIYCYFRNGNSTLKCANYYEILLEPADTNTKERLINGYDYIERIGIDIKIDNKIVGYIGKMSDLFWHTFYDQYRIEENGYIESCRDDKYDFTLQIWDDALFNNAQEFELLVEKVLFECDVNLNLCFKRTSYSFKEKIEAHNENLSLMIWNTHYEEAPFRYFNFANYTTVPRHKYLAYYQVIEYFFVRAFQKSELTIFKELRVLDYLIRTSLENELVFEWITTNGLCTHFTELNTNYPALLPLDKSNVLDTIAKRLYTVRCSLVHAKETKEGYNFIPNLNDSILDKEIGLIKYVAEHVLRKWNIIT